MSLGKDIFSQTIMRFGSAIYFRTAQTELTYNEFGLLVSSVSNSFPSYDHRGIALIACKCPINFVTAYFSCVMAGVIPMPISEQTKGWELLNHLEGADHFLTDCLHYQDHPAFFDYSIIGSNIYNYNIIPKTKHYNFMDYDPRIAVLIPTSGTFGKVKRVALTFENILSNVDGIIRVLNLQQADSAISVLPLYYSFAHTTQMWLQFILGSELITTEGPLAIKQFFELCDKYRPTSTGIVGATIKSLLKMRARSNTYDLSSLKRIIVAGGKTSEDLLKDITQMFPNAKILQGYGLTEASPRVALETEDDIPRCWNNIRSSGKPLPGVKVKIIAPDGKEQPIQQEGLIHIQGPNVMLGYYGDVENTNKTIQNSWLNSGDIGFVDSDGYLFVYGREKNMFVHNGRKIYPEEVESLLIKDERIQNCIIFQKDEQYNLLIQTDAAITADEVRDHLILHLPHWKIPDVISFGEVKVTPNGKIVRT